ncbi:MAG: M48 family metallopeptidase [Desulfohalobiaceae bacterium]
MRKAIHPIPLLGICLLVLLLGCEGVNLRQAKEAGEDAVKAVTLSEEQVRELARRAAERADEEHELAPPESSYSGRLERLVREHGEEEGHSYEYRVYLSSKVNAFAMADGSIRIYSGLMDKMSDQELLFVLGHEMGHVVENHIMKKMRVALAGSALRKGIASQENVIGELAESQLGGLVNKLIQARFSREEEEEADRYAVRFMQQEGYNPHKSVSALKKLGAMSAGSSLLSSHPAPKARAEKVKEQLRSGLEDEEDTGIWDTIWGLLRTIGHWVVDAIAWVIDLIPGVEIPSEDPQKAMEV